MKNKILSLFLVTSLVTPLNVLAENITITVKGMVCSFCAQGIKKTFLKNKNVKDIKVDLDNKLVKIQTHDGVSIGDEELTLAINDAGYDVQSIKRGDDD